MLQKISLVLACFTLSTVAASRSSANVTSAPTKAILVNSIKAVAVTPTGDPNQPLLTRDTLTSTEESATIDCEFALQLHNTDELHARLAQGQKISAQEMAAKYEPTAADYNQVEAWVKSQGLTVTADDPQHHLAVFVRASVKQLKSSMNVAFGRVMVNNQEYTSALTAPTVPGWMSSVLLGVNGLQPHIRPHHHILMGPMRNAAGYDTGVIYTPAQIAAAYNATALYNDNLTGSGQTIAIVIDAFPLTSDLTLFWKKVGSTQNISNIQFINANPGTAMNPPSGEETLDTSWSSSMAPGAKVRVYGSGTLLFADLDKSYAALLADVTAHPEYNINQMSMSLGLGETYMSPTQVTTDDNYYSELTAAGVTCFASTGDHGATPDDFDSDTGPLQVEFPSSDTYVTAVGGTSLHIDQSTNTVNSEVVWNDSHAKVAGATGGGVSVLFSRPAWQVGSGVDTSAMRQVPDISATADLYEGATLYLNGNLFPVGGTSWSSPICAAFCALLNEARTNAGQSVLGLLGPHIYPLIGSSAFRDIVSGDNSTPTSGGLYKATANYDKASGIGAPLMLNLAQQVVGSSLLTGVTPSAPVVEVQPGQPAVFTIGKSGPSATYQWQEMILGSGTWTDLNNGAPFSGVTTPVLTISPTTAAMTGTEFRCEITFTSSTVDTTPSTLVVSSPVLVSTIAGYPGSIGLQNGGSGTGKTAQFKYPSGIAVDSAGNVYVADRGNNVIRKITPAGTVTTPYGSTSGVAGNVNGAGNAARFDSPYGVAVDPSGNIFVADTFNNSIRKISNGVVSNFVTSGLFQPQGIATDSSGNVYVADTGNNVIDEITPSGTVTVIAGDFSQGYSDGPAGAAEFDSPVGVAVDSSGNVFVADAGNFVVREISGTTVSTVAGSAGQQGYLDGDGTNAMFDAPIGIGIDDQNNLYITDSLIPQSSTAAGNDVIREVTPSGVVSTIAGNPGTTGSTNGFGQAAEFDSVQGVAFGNGGHLYMVDTYNQTIRAGAFQNKSVATIALSNLTATFDGTPKPVTVTTTPSGLGVSVSYNGSAVPPTAVGTYQVVATINDPAYTGSTTGTLVISYATSGPAVITFGNTNFIYDGNPHPVTYTVQPPGVAASVTYNGSPTPPTLAGTYTVVATVTTSGFTGSATTSEVISPLAPLVTTGNSSAVTGSSATLSETATPRGSATTAYFEYGLTTTYGNTSGTTAVGSGNTPVPATQTLVLTALPTATTYHYRAVATNAGGTAYGSDRTFTTPPVPTITTTPTPFLSATDAEVTLAVNPDGSPVTVYIQYGTTTSYGSDTASIKLGAGKSPTNIFLLFPNLLPGTTYDYQVVMVSSAGTFYGPPQSFTTLNFSTVLVAASGQSAPGSSSTFATFGPPAINTHDGVAFTGTIAARGANAGLWADNSSSMLNLIANAGGSAPGNSGTFTSFSDPVYNDNYAVAFVGTTSTRTTGVWTNDSGTLEPVALQGSGSPSSPGNFASFGSLGLTDSAGPVFYATVSGGGVTSANNAGIFEGDSAGTWALHLGQIVSGKTITKLSFMPAVPYVGGQSRSFNTAGDLACLASFSDGTTGFAEYVGGAASASTYSGLSADMVAGATYASFGNPAINNNDHLAYQATISGGGITNSTNTGIWADNSSGTRSLVAQEGVTTAPGTTAFFAGFNDPVINNHEAVAFRATLKVASGQATSSTATGVWETASNLTGLTLVAQQGVQAPGCPLGATFANFVQVVLPDVDGVEFLATLNTNSAAGITAGNNTGIWGVDNNGTLQLIVRTGDVIGGKTITSLSFLSDPAYVTGQNRSFASTGDLVYLATFSDKSTAIYGVVFP